MYTNTVPAGAIRGYGMTQTIFAVESAMDELARTLPMDPIAFRRRNIVRPEDQRVAGGMVVSDTELQQLRARSMPRPGRAPWPGATAAPAGSDWLEGQGVALAMHGAVPPTEHRSRRVLAWATTASITWRSALPSLGNGTTTVHGQIVAAVLGSTVSQVRIVQADTDCTGYDTAFASAGTVVAGKRGTAGRRGAARTHAGLRGETLRRQP